MPTRITLIYHAYKNFEVPNKIAKMINDGTISWRSHHDDLFYTDEDGKDQCLSSNIECVEWEGHDDYEVAESEEESDEESECCECQQHGGDGCKCDCHSQPSDDEEEKCECEDWREDVTCSCLYKEYKIQESTKSKSE